MYRYNTKLRIAGSVMNEIRKDNISAAEAMLLRRLHGGDALVDMEELKNDKTPHADEREKLQRIYGKALTKLEPKITFEQLFGPSHNPLPPRLMDFEMREREANRKGGKPIPKRGDVPARDVNPDDLAA